jgi:hypothetical protein
MQAVQDAIHSHNIRHQGVSRIQNDDEAAIFINILMRIDTFKPVEMFSEPRYWSFNF